MKWFAPQHRCHDRARPCRNLLITADMKPARDIIKKKIQSNSNDFIFFLTLWIALSTDLTLMPSSFAVFS